MHTHGARHPDYLSSTQQNLQNSTYNRFWATISLFLNLNLPAIHWFSTEHPVITVIIHIGSTDPFFHKNSVYNTNSIYPRSSISIHYRNDNLSFINIHSLLNHIHGTATTHSHQQNKTQTCNQFNGREKNKPGHHSLAQFHWFKAGLLSHDRNICKHRAEKTEQRGTSVTDRICDIKLDKHELISLPEAWDLELVARVDLLSTVSA